MLDTFWNLSYTANSIIVEATIKSVQYLGNKQIMKRAALKTRKLSNPHHFSQYLQMLALFLLAILLEINTRLHNMLYPYSSRDVTLFILTQL